MVDRTGIVMALSAFAVALLCILPATRDVTPLWIIASGMHIASTLFHELGHTLFYWLFGQPAIPMIFTLFGADQAGGMSMSLERLWPLQFAVYGVLAYGCYWLWQNWQHLFIPVLVFSLAIVVLSFTRYYTVVIAYMGHGGAIAMGGFFLFRAWVYLDARNAYERWLNAFFGFFLVLYNGYFAYTLAFDPLVREGYSDHAAFGVTHNDFWKMAMEVPGWSVRGIGIFTMAYCAVVVIASFIFATYLSDDFDEMDVA